MSKRHSGHRLTLFEYRARVKDSQASRDDVSAFSAPRGFRYIVGVSGHDSGSVTFASTAHVSPDRADALLEVEDRLSREEVVNVLDVHSWKIETIRDKTTSTLCLSPGEERP